MTDSTAEIVATVIAHRKSVRRFADKPVPPEILDALVTAGIQAPSGSNSQNQRFLVVTEADEIERIGKLRFVWPYRGTERNKIEQRYPAGIVGLAKAIIVVFADAQENDRRGNGEYYLWERLEVQNSAASIENILVLATAMGLASCWVSAGEAMNHTRLLSGSTWRKVLRDYEIPPTYKIQGIVLLGYPLDVDALGFAKGEKRHGATVWQSTERKPLQHYLIGRHTVGSSIESTGGLIKWRLRTLSAMLQLLLRGVSVLDRAIHRIEMASRPTRHEEER